MLFLVLIHSIFSYHVYLKHYKSDFYVCDTPHHDIHTDIPEPCGCDRATVYNVLPLNSFDVMILDVHTGKAFNLTCGDKLSLFLNTGFENQIFSLKTVADNVFAISHRGKCIEPNPHGNGYDYVPCDGSDNQLFEFIHIESDLYSPRVVEKYVEPYRHLYKDHRLDCMQNLLSHDCRIKSPYSPENRPYNYILDEINALSPRYTPGCGGCPSRDLEDGYVHYVSNRCRPSCHEKYRKPCCSTPDCYCPRGHNCCS